MQCLPNPDLRLVQNPAVPQAENADLDRLISCMRAALAGTYSIVTLVNGAALGNSTHPAVAGGMQWYVDQVLGNGTFGSGGSYNLFYTNPSVITVS